MAERGQPALEVVSLSKSFGAVRAVADVSFGIGKGTLAALIGPNGAGKSTLLLCVAGFLRQEHGRVVLDGEDISAWRPHRRARAGLGTVFQVHRAIPQLTVLENAMVGAHAWTSKGFVAGIVKLPAQRREEREIRAAAREALELVGLGARADDPAEALPLGQLRLLAVARVLAQRPHVLLLDEPAAGLRAREKDQLIAVFRDLRERGLTQVLVEHDMQFVGSLAERVLVLDRGSLIADGTPEEVRRDERVVTAYLGTAAEAA